MPFRLGPALGLGLLVGCSPFEGFPSATGTPTSKAYPTTTDTSPTTSTTDSGTLEPYDRIGRLGWHLHPDVGSVVFVTWEQTAPEDVVVEYSFEKGEWLRSPVVAGNAGPNQRVIVGIPYGTQTTKVDGRAVGLPRLADYRLVALADGFVVEAEQPIAVAPAPPTLPLPEVQISDERSWLPEGHYVLTSINEEPVGWAGGWYWTVIYDRQGRPVWAHRAPDRNWTLFAQVSQSGDHLLWDEITEWSDFDDGAGSQIHRTYLDDRISTVKTPGLHHAFVELPDGTLAWGSKVHGGAEALVALAPDKNKVDVLWTCETDWPGSIDEWGLCQSNGLFYRADTDSFLYSFYTNNSLVEVSRTGDTLWWAGTVPGGFDFNPPESQFDWQHGVSYTDDGTLLVSSRALVNDTFTTMLREYQVRPVRRILEEVWSFDAEEYAITNGDAWRLDNGNTLHTLGSAGVLLEVTQEKTVVWRLDFGGDHLLGRSELVTDLYDLVKPAP
ncbi:MAG: arylsulfotransferase family protein [Myxococcales bacterium]|nr:arylsulfotransferase family protein [Myxococcales bacterium]